MVFVGANWFSKALFLTIHLQRMYRPLREQVRSHGYAFQSTNQPIDQPVSDHLPFTTICAGASPNACQFGRYMDSTCGGGTRYVPGVTARAR
ncbi:Cellobiose phosphorylase [Pseudomonas syringae pv. actinidiae]|uniref:Cellobiose phosphorylase n=1 Tax=Pseudomonas syringae pv. actinidiae TaxID=103796 RepID=A0A2V0QSF7_PSESF|nr:Cellobiose phosphorylase [Pseudomonas syringae pv. actinidiae]